MRKNKQFKKKQFRKLVAASVRSIRYVDSVLGDTSYTPTVISSLQQLAGFRVTGR